MSVVKKININDLIHVSANNEVRPLHIILGTRNHDKMGEITNIIDPPSVNFQLTAADELSFNVYEYKDGMRCALWDELITFRTVWVKEYDEWFEIIVTIDDSSKNTKKIITGTSLCEAELSQINMDATEINTEDDPNWTDDLDEYTPTIFYDSSHTQYSLLHRVLKKMPNYTIKHVDYTLAKIQRSFSIANSATVYNTLVDTIANEIGCFFIFDSNERGIYVYDLETTCLTCGKRMEQSLKVCPDCGGTTFHEPYGYNTTIFIDKNNLGTSLQASIDADSVKNCLKVEGGDDSMSAAVRNVSPSGSNYIYALSEEVRQDMPDELVEKFDAYYVLLNDYKTKKQFTYTEKKVNNYNTVINRIRTVYADNIEKDDDFFPYYPIKTSYIGYGYVVKIYYDTIDLYLYLKDGMMPTYRQSDESAEQQVKLIDNSVATVSLANFKNCTQASSESAVRMYVRAIVDTSRYRVEVVTSSFTKDTATSTARWVGDIILTNYSDDDDTASRIGKNVVIDANYSNYLQQMVDKLIAKVDTQGIQDIFDSELSLSDFKKQIKFYCYASLESFYNAYQTCLDLFTEADISTNTSSELYKKFYLPYYNKLMALEDELAVRANDIEVIQAIQNESIKIMDRCEEELDFQTYLGDELYCTFLNYRREDTYKNDNYVSDGLTNAELIDKAEELIEAGNNELEKSNTRQYSINGSITNLLLLKDENGKRPFAEWLNDFTLGNYIHTKIDGEVYNMRLANISFDYSSPETLTVSFYDITKASTQAASEARRLLDTVKTMGSSYSSTQRQASQGEEVSYAFAKLQEEGLKSAQYNVYNEDTTVLIDEHGILCRTYDDILDTYSDNQSRLAAAGLLFTKDNWRSTVTALGRQTYTLNGIDYEEYGVNAEFCIAGKIIAGDIYSADYKTDSSGTITSGTHINLNNGNFDFAGGKLSYNGTNLTVKKGGFIGGYIQSENYQGSTIGTKIDLDNSTFELNGKSSTDPKLTYTYSSGKGLLALTDGAISSSTFIGGEIQSSATYNGNQPITLINLTDGTFTFAKGNLTYTTDNVLSVKNGTISGGKITSTNTYTYNSVTSPITTIDLDNGTFNFARGKLTYNGTTLALDGTIETTAGHIGGWVIDSNSLHSDSSKTTGYVCLSPTYSNRIAIGSSSSDLGFTVNSAGYLTAKNAKLGEWYINTTDEGLSELYSSNNGYKVYMQTPNDKDTWVYSIQNEDGSDFYFYITRNGEMAINDESAEGIRLIGAARRDPDNGNKIISGKDGTEVAILRDGINLFYRTQTPSTDYNKLTRIGKGYISIDADGENSHYWISEDDNDFKDYHRDDEGVALSVANGDCILERGYSQESDRRVKKDITPLSSEQTASFIYSLVPSEFRYNNGERLHHGLIAQEVQNSMAGDDWGLFIDRAINAPSLQDISDEDTTTPRYLLRYEELIPDLIATVQSLNNRLQVLENQQ